MNTTIQTLLNHRSIRSYSKTPVSDQDLMTIIKCAQAGPNSINGQQFSVIVIKSDETKEKLAGLCGDQDYIASAPVFLIFVADYYKAKLAAEKNEKPLVITQDVESLLVASVDIGIALGNAIAAAESLGLGIVPIGGVRKNPDDLIKLLNLPEFVFPMAGLCIGYADSPSTQKPRMPMETFMHLETYNTNLENLIEEYDEAMSDYMFKRTQGKSKRNWSSSVSGLYKSVYYPKVTPTLIQQGFLKPHNT